MFRLAPETAHRFGLRSAHGLLGMPGGKALVQRLAGGEPIVRPVQHGPLWFRNRVGLAAGFDKNAEHIRLMDALGFGFVEIGSVTARPWAGNPKPRLFRLAADGALINRMGLNNEGANAVAARLAQARPGVDLTVLANIAKTPAPELSGREAIEDYATSARTLAPHADGLVVNVSCPNTEDGRTFEEPSALRELLPRVRDAAGHQIPIWVKLSVDRPPDELDEAVEVAIGAGYSGLVMSNTTRARPQSLTTPASQLESIGRGGLSGQPLAERSREAVRRVSVLSKGRLVVVGVGGVMGGDDARAMSEAGADLVEAYTGFIYAGPTFARDVAAAL